MFRGSLVRAAMLSPLLGCSPAAPARPPPTPETAPTRPPRSVRAWEPSRPSEPVVKQLEPLLDQRVGASVDIAPVLWFAHDNRSETGFVSYTYRRLEQCEASADAGRELERCREPLAGSLHLPTCEGRGIARFVRNSADDLPRLASVFDLGDSVCNSDVTMFELRDVDADGEPELVVAVRWAEEVWVVVGPSRDDLGPDVSVQGERVVFFHTDLGVQLDLVTSLIPVSPEAHQLGHAYHSGRYTLRDANGDSHPDVVVVEVPHGQGSQPRTRVLLYDAERDRWTPPREKSPG